ncbi:MAG: capsule biosynthesis protein CapC, partial [Clostridiales bacterium]|nr:capsule biosynthesis protein CapC [Clostridiales bacterium]
VVGRIIPGLIANDMLRQGFWRTLLSVVLVALVVWLLLALGTALGLP